jgi:hypothetical protein
MPRGPKGEKRPADSKFQTETPPVIHMADAVALIYAKQVQSVRRPYKKREAAQISN